MAYANHSRLKNSFVIFSLAVAISIISWAGTATFSIPGLTSIASAQFRGALLGSTTNQTVPNLTETTVAWNTVAYDTDNFNTVPSFFIIPAGVSKIRVSGSVVWSPYILGSRFLWVELNGQTIPLGRGLSSIPATQNIAMGQEVRSAVIQVSQGQSLRLKVYQNSGIPLTVYGSNTASWFAIEVLE